MAVAEEGGAEQNPVAKEQQQQQEKDGQVAELAED